MLIIKDKGIFADHRGSRVDEVLEEIREKLTPLRGQLSDIGQEFSGLKDNLSTAEHGLTLVICYLYGVKEELSSKKGP